MGIWNIDKFFHPEAIAVIGASEHPGRIGTALMHNLIRGGFTGRLLPVNPKYSRIMGLPSASTISEIDTRIDLAVVAVPIHQVPEVIDQCAAVQVKTAIVISSGGKEIGESGRIVEERILRAATSGGIRILGPNCLGVMAPGAKLNASFTAGMPNKGNLAFVSQSGGICTAILDMSFQEGIGFSHFVSIGSMLDVDFGDMIDYLGRDPAAKSILLYVEQLTNIRKFMSAARAVSRIKPIIVLKAGTSAAGAKVASSHTGALAGEDAIYDAAFRRAGVIRVSTIEELFDSAELTAKQPRPSGPRLAVITNGGGPGVMAVDAMARHTLEPAVLGATTLSALNEILPQHWNHQNPVDILGDATAERYGQVMEILSRESGLHGLMVIFLPQALTDPMAVAKQLVQHLKGRPFPIFAVWMGGRDVAGAIEFLNEAGIATYATPERAVHAFATLVQHTRNLELLKEIPPRSVHRFFFDRAKARAIVEATDLACGVFLTEPRTKELLLAYGIHVNPTRTADSFETAAAVAEEMGWPVAIKVLSPDITHKTEADGVHLDLRDAGDVREAYARIIAGAKRVNEKAHIEGVTVQPYLARPDFELMLGIKRDELFGPVLLFGSGGIYTEIIADRALSLPPLNGQLIRRLVDETRVAKLLAGYRNHSPIDMTALESMLLQLSQLAVDIPEIAELDMNPVIVKNGTPVVVDARILLRPSLRPSPLHLVISPYPSQYEVCTTTRSGLRLGIRPILPEDAELFVELFRTLSPTSVYYRFFRHMKSLTPELLAMLTQVDYDRHLALVALDLSSPTEKMFGVARVIGDPDLSHTEFSIMVGDPWQGQGVGAALLLNLLKAARKQGVEKVWGTVLRENTQMLRLGKKAGFIMKFNSEEGAYDLNIDLTTAELED
ncbi:MAG: bifunctional acetate--CoA ligase family protein/GNAT family N-acetyltransferase [Proteobacteria bacterium]|nr:bifunctional acetate--CoA ligase family protein/GNAT family N-acetyltransferase [Pseudomonadota bacterium]